MRFKFSEISRVWPIAKRRLAASIASCSQKMLVKEVLAKDVFATKHPKRVLLCHLPEAFKNKKLPKHHSNLTECYTIARCFDRLGYSVDCTSRSNTGIDYSPYDIVFGINGNAFMGAFKATNNPLKIFYPVGAEMSFNYRVTTARNKDFFERHRKWLLNSNRYMPGDGRAYYEATLSDAVVVLGNEFVLEQYLKQDTEKEKYYLLPAFYFNVIEPLKEKDFSVCKKNILWFGSSGMIHKGLDIAIDFVTEHNDFTLHICGGSRLEKEFWEHYNPIIEKQNNITLHGFVDIESEEFSKTLSTCGILLNPSISEGCAVAVLNVLGNSALLPVYSKGTGLNLSENGIELPDVTYKAFEKALLEADSMSAEEFGQRALAVHKSVRENYTIEQYEKTMYSHIKEIIEKRDRI